MPNDNATPRPWRKWNGTITAGSFEDEVKICEFNSTCRGGFNGEANADLIVRAVNSFDALLEALKFAREIVYKQGTLANALENVKIIDNAITQAQAK